MEQLGDASKHEHRYVVYRHKATVESSGSEENGVIWVWHGAVFRCSLVFCGDTIRHYGSVAESFARSLTRQAVVARRCWYSHGRTGFGLSSC